MIYEHYRYGIDTQISATMVLIHVSEWDAHQNLRLKLVIPENSWLRICWSGSYYGFSYHLRLWECMFTNTHQP